jgi:protein involved in polysaccharide export with SLBB domain
MTAPPSSPFIRRARRYALALCAAALAGCAATTPNFVSSPPPGPRDEAPLPLSVGDLIEVDYFPTANVVSQAYRVGVDDRLRIDVFEHPPLSREQLLVLPDGTISAPEIGRLAVGGKTLEEVTRDVAESLRRAHVRDPRVAVSVQQSDARLRSLVNRSADSSTTELNLFQIADNGELLLPFIESVSALKTIETLRADIAQAYRRVFGDRLEVTVKLRQARARYIYVMGEVVKPGTVEYLPTLSSLGAVAAAGGLLPTAESSTIVLFRRYPDGRHSAWLLDMRTLLTQSNAESQRIAIRPEDVLYVPKTGVALANDAIDQYVRRMLPFSGNFGINVNR